jgi:hypothetical protein
MVTRVRATPRSQRGLLNPSCHHRIRDYRPFLSLATPILSYLNHTSNRKTMRDSRGGGSDCIIAFADMAELFAGKVSGLSRRSFAPTLILSRASKSMGVWQLRLFSGVTHRRFAKLRRVSLQRGSSGQSFLSFSGPILGMSIPSAVARSIRCSCS